MAVAPATRRDVAAHGPSAGSGGGAEARTPIRRRRAHSHRPGLCSDKWGASCPDVWSRGPRASPRQRGSCPGPRRSYGGPGPTKPVRPLSPPQRGASSRTCTYPPPPRNPPTSFPHPPLRHSRESGNPGGGAGHPSPRRAATPGTADEERRPHARRWTQTRPCWRSCNVPPPGATPLLAYLRKTPPGPTDPARDPGRSQSKEDHPTASARAPSPGNNCCFTPRPASRDDKKTQSNLTQGD